MNPLYVIIPLLVVIAAVAYGIIRALGRIWLDHQIKVELLERIQQKPELLRSFQEVQSLMNEIPAGPYKANRQDYTVTGIILTLIGIACTVVGRSWGVGTLAVGTYVGGWVCVVLGLVLGFVGLIIRWLSRNPLVNPKKP